MVVRQFRYLLLIREILEQGGGVKDVMEDLRFLQSKNKPVPYWMADKLSRQARGFTLPVLEGIYQRLLKIDEEVKSGQIPLELVLEIFVTELTTRHRAHSRSISH
jgi:DNA polymerase III delta subunit